MTSTLNTRDLTDGFSRPAPRLVTIFASIGAVFLTIEAWVIGRWITSDRFTPVSLGDDKVSTFTLVVIRIFEFGGVALALAMIWWAWRTSRRQGRLSIQAVLIIAFATLWWQDPGVSWARPGFFYNGHFLNFGSWTADLPGAINPTAAKLPEPTLCMGAAYVYGMLLCAMFVASVMRLVRSRFPRINIVGLIAAGTGAAMILDLIVEVVLIRWGLYVYPTTIHDLSLFGGTRWQFPLYESLFWGPVWAAGGLLYYFRDDTGATFVERGVDDVRIPSARPVLRILAVVGFMNLVYLAYNVAMVWTTFVSDPMPDGIPSYFVTEQCGPGTDYACPSPYVAVPLPESGPNPPTPAG